MLLRQNYAIRLYFRTNKTLSDSPLLRTSFGRNQILTSYATDFDQIPNRNFLVRYWTKSVQLLIVAEAGSNKVRTQSE